MSDMKQLFTEVLDVPSPPMTSSEAVLDRAHRARRRRSVAWGTAAAAAAAVAVVVTATVPSLLGTGGSADTSAASPTAQSSPSTAGTASIDPSATNATPSQLGTNGPEGCATELVTSGPEAERGKSMLSALTSRVPAGYTQPTTDSTMAEQDGGQVVTFPLREIWIKRSTDKNCAESNYEVFTQVYKDGKGGKVSASVKTGILARDPSGDLCGKAATAYAIVLNGCRSAVTAGGTRAVVFSYQLPGDKYPGLGAPKTVTYFEAVVMYRGCTVSVTEGPLANIGVNSPKPLTERIFTDLQLLEIAASPEFKL